MRVLMLFFAILAGTVHTERVHFDFAFDPNSAVTTATSRIVDVASGQTAVITDLELGDSVEGAILELVSEPSNLASFSVQVQYETSVTIMNEGPHLDLVEWKHYTSEWRNIERIGSAY